MITTEANTIAVVCIVSLRVGHDTRPASAHASCAKRKKFLRPASESQATPARRQPAQHHQHAQHDRGVGEVVVPGHATDHARDRQ